MDIKIVLDLVKMNVEMNSVPFSDLKRVESQRIVKKYATSVFEDAGRLVP